MSELLYVADPMCSWCWGFAETLAEVDARLAPEVRLRYVMGGLAPDDDAPMPDELRRYVRAAWDAVEARTGARFNRDFWERCEPRRSTWPACRAVLAAEAQRPGAGQATFRAIQRAYYLEARNPSDRATLVALAGELGLDAARFERDLDSDATRAALEADLAEARALGVTGFPSLVARVGDEAVVLARGWVPREPLLAGLRDRGLVA